MVPDENMQPIEITNFFSYTKKGSKTLRRILDYVNANDDYYLRMVQVKTFKKCTGINQIRRDISQSNFKRWNIYGIPNRLKTFLIKYYNNILGTGSRVVHIDRTKDPACIFCSLNNCRPAPIESFSHIFYHCPYVNKVIKKFCSKFFFLDINEENYFSGNFHAELKNNEPIIFILDVLRYAIWEFKLRKLNMSYYTLENEMLYQLDIIMGCSKKIKYNILNCPFICPEGEAEGRRQEGEGP